MWDLTVTENHDFFVEFSIDSHTSVLVHNCPDRGGSTGHGKGTIPSWFRNGTWTRESGQSAQQFATRVLNKKFGPGRWNTGPGSEFNRIVKYVTCHGL